jgi:uncharacterized repeat protein (TIGR01451 family)
MRTKSNTPSGKLRLNTLILVGVFLMLSAAVAIPLHSARSSSARSSGPSKLTTRASSSKTALSPRSSMASMLSPVPLLLESIATYDDATCSTPKTDFFLGDTVCVKATGVPTSVFPWRITWVDPDGFIRQSDPAVADDATEYRYTLPTSPTETINERTVDNRGTWTVNLTRPTGAVRQTARFTVHEAANPLADVFIQKFQRNVNQVILTGDNAAFIIVVGNTGPDAAADVHLIDSLPPSSTLSSFNQDSGPQCLPLGAQNCTIAAMTNGERAEFTAIYTINASPGTYQTSAAVSTTTTDPNSSNNSSTAAFVVQTGSAGGTCELTCPEDITTTANTEENGQRGAHVSYAAPEGTGDCGAITSSPSSGSFFPVGTTAVTATSETGGGSCQFTVTVEEESGNVTISCPANKEADANSVCEANVSVGTATGTGDNVTVIGTRSDGRPMYDCDANGTNCVRRASDDPFPAGTTTITWIAYSHDTPGPYADQADEESHRTGSKSCVQTVIVNDVTPPTIAATDSTVSADANCSAVIPDYSSTVTDNCACGSADESEACEGHPHIVYSQTPAAGTVVGLGSHNVHIEATDGSSNNNGATKDVTFTVNDTTAPTVQGPADSSASADANCQAPVPDYTANSTASDNCDTSVTFTQSPAAGTLVGIGPHTVTVTGTDDAGNQGSDDVIFTVNDTTAPTVQAPADSSASADANCQAPVPDYTANSTASDNCDTSVTFTQSPAAGTLVGLGPHTVTVTGTDDAGNQSSDDVIFTVNDTTAPTINCPANITRSNDPGMCSATVNPGTATATDNCDTTPTIVGTRSDNQPLNATYPKGTTTIHWTATDDAGNSSSCDQTVTVNDTENPTISCPSNITKDNDPGTCGAVVTYTPPVGSDNCPGATTAQTAGLPSGSTFPVGTTTNTFEVTDSSGNKTSCSFTVTVNDVENPVISCPSSQTLEPTCPSGAVGNWTEPVGTDNCPGATTTMTGPAPGTVFAAGTTTTITYTVNDAHGHSASCSFTITVKTVNQTIEDLKTSVNNSSLSPQNKGGLVSKLQAAQDALAQGKTNVACQKLADFINSTQNLINHGDISAAQGNAWISTATHLRNTIGCTNNPCS